MLQAKNELMTGHLQRFLEMNMPLFDRLYAIDDSSTDGTLEALERADAYVLRKSFDSFKRELVIKNQLLSKIRELEGEDTWVVRLDADEVIYASRNELESLIALESKKGYDSIALPHLNLWRTERHVRTDDGFASFNPVRIWRLGADVNFPDKQGLHITSDPLGLKKTKYGSYFPVVHFGFASDESIIQKAVSYWSFGQRGYALNRLILDSNSTFRHLDEYADVLGERFTREQKSGGIQPLKGGLPHMFNQALVDRVEQPRITLISLIFSGVEWLEFQYAELLRLAKEFRRGYVEVLFVANDPTPEIESFLKDNGIPHKVFRGSKEPGEWYINSVYRAYNFGVNEAKGELVMLTNSDMAYTPGFLSSMLEMFDPTKLNTARLVESGRLPSGELGVEKDFGSTPKKFRKYSFYRYAEKLKEARTIPGGLFMPLLVEKKAFSSLGGFPEGNVRAGDLEKYLSGKSFAIAKKDEPLVPGDQAFFRLAEQKGLEHRTIANSVAYHFQEGELQSSRRKSRSVGNVHSGVAIVNDSIRGVSGEPVFWSTLGRWLSEKGLRTQFVESGRPKSVISDLLSPLRVWWRAKRTFSRGQAPRLIFQNATYQLPISGGIARVSFVQDRPVSRRLRWLQRACVQRSAQNITNDLNYFETRLGRKLRWLPIPLSDFWIRHEGPSETVVIDEVRRILFVGQMNSTKGWDSILSTLEDSEGIKWRLILKDDPKDIALFQQAAPIGVEILTNCNQEEVKTHMRWADILVSASPVETQHLASLEAISQNTPVLVTPTGLLGNFGPGDHSFGKVTGDISLNSVRQMEKVTFSPRAFFEREILDNEHLKLLWSMEIEDLLQETFVSLQEASSVQFAGRLKSAFLDVLRRTKRKLIKLGQRFVG